MKGALLAAVLVCSCASVDELSPGLAVDVLAQPSTTPPLQPDGSLLVSNDLGYEVHLVRAYLVASTVEIFPCPTVAGALGRWFVGRAEAHAVGSPTRLGTAFVEPVIAGDADRALGTIAPPPDRYCRASFGASAADRDAIGMPADRPLAGSSLYLEGSVAHAGGEGHLFRVTSAAAFSVTSDIAPLSLSAGAPHATLVVRKQADHWFDGVDFDAQTADQIAASVLDNVRRSISLERE